MVLFLASSDAGGERLQTGPRWGSRRRPPRKTAIKGAGLKSVRSARCPSVSTPVFSRRVPGKISWGGCGDASVFEKILKHIHVPSAVVCDDIKSHIVE